MLANSARGFAGVPEGQAGTTNAYAFVRRDNLMQSIKFARSTTLRWTLLVAALFAGFVVALLGFVYLKTKRDLTIRSDRMIASQMSVFVDLSPARRLHAIDEHLKQDPWRVRLVALFDTNSLTELG